MTSRSLTIDDAIATSTNCATSLESSIPTSARDIASCAVQYCEIPGPSTTGRRCHRICRDSIIADIAGSTVSHGLASLHSCYHARLTD